MTSATIYYLLIGIISFEFILERVLGFLNYQSSKKPIPEELEGIYDPERYQKSQSYLLDVSKFGWFSAVFSFLLLLGAITFGWFGWIDQWIKGITTQPLLVTLIFFGTIYFINDIIGIPFSLYRNFVIEERYGFNKMSATTYLADKLKGYLLTFIFGGSLLSLLIYLVEAIGIHFWVYFWGVMITFTLFANIFYTTLILPLFNRLTPLEDGDLKASIQDYCDQVNFPLKNIFVMDGSKRSSKGNAFFSGLGGKKKVVLFDTLIEKHSTEELTAILAHEVGHYKKKHVISSTLFSLVLTGFMLFLFSRMIFSDAVSQALGAESAALHLNMLAFGILYSPISTVFGTIGNLISRKNEYEADHYAKTTFKGQPLIDSLKKMSADHLSNLTPHPAYVFMNYSHPPLKERIEALRK